MPSAQHLVVAAVLAAPLLACSTVTKEIVAPPPVVLKSEAACADVPALGHPLVVANYNIKSGVWTSLDGVGGVIDGLHADVVALEEVDKGMQRSGGVDESAVLAKRLGAERVFAGTLDFDGGTYGIALLSRLPIVKVDRFDLPRANGFEPRVAIDATVCAGKTPVRVIAAHADFLPWAAEEQAKAIAARIGDDHGVIVLGDFNATATDTGMRALIAGGRTDAVAAFDEGMTFPGTKSRIDFILTGRAIKGAKRVVNNASDHFPVTATIDLGPDDTQLASGAPAGGAIAGTAAAVR